MASQPPYPIDDIQTPDDAPAPDTEATSSPDDESVAPAPEIPPQPSAEPIPVEPVTNADDAAGPAATATPGAIAAPFAIIVPATATIAMPSLRLGARARGHRGNHKAGCGEDMGDPHRPFLSARGSGERENTLFRRTGC